MDAQDSGSCQQFIWKNWLILDNGGMGIAHHLYQTQTATWNLTDLTCEQVGFCQHHGDIWWGCYEVTNPECVTFRSESQNVICSKYYSLEYFDFWSYDQDLRTV